ncbi:MAG TPA: SDR family oxidoreductase, partial [Candidatus Limnocylindria bacterium]|nr:SDR family oxidoreductase [Candidatus Limnocylindria bacterium]
MVEARPQVVVITGASAGVGRALARLYGARGASVGLIARGVDGLEGAAREITDAGGRALVLPLDVADAAAVEDAAERIEQELGPIDLWINNAMASVFSPVHEMRAEEYERVTKVTYLGYVHGALAALKRMRPRDHGTILFVGSALAYRGIPLQSAYCGAKHATKGFFESVRTELMSRDSGVRVTMVQLPGLNTPQFSHCRSKMPNAPMPVPPIFQPEVAADAIVWAAEHSRREVYVGGSTVKVIEGNKVAAGVADRYLARTGVDSQQTDERIGGRDGNLFEPVPGDPGPHGSFDDQAKGRSIQLWFSKHR